jgi:hypothetical protein
MGDQERSGRLGSTRSEGCGGVEKRHELLAGVDREAVDGVGDDAGVDGLGQVEAYSQSPGPDRAGSLPGIVGKPAPSE